MLTRMNAPMEAYLQPSEWIDFHNPVMWEAAAGLKSQAEEETSLVKLVYEFVRDQILHSYDAGLTRVTAKASDTLREGHGICYAKSHLLAAMLRACGIPAGICYQRLTLFDTAESGFCIHALNTVYIRSLETWTRLDARGNKPGVDARFSLDAEYLAFPVREEIGEKDDTTNYAQPHPVIIQTLTTHDNGLLMYENHLPDSL
ncbi:MAG: transglutaminase family protein [Paenibacillus sp.]|jgi:transglutaminase-like putative cysteine protease|nr:transglutaminase family protein [Paenibacillus sp.]